MEPILQVQHLTHTYSVGTPFQRSAVEDMSFDVYDGEFLGIIGHTGSGKSTLTHAKHGGKQDNGNCGVHEDPPEEFFLL